MSSINSLLDLNSWRLSTPDLIQQIGTLLWINQGEDGKWLAELSTKARVGYEVYRRLSNEDQIEAYRTECYAAIAKYLKENPKANKKQVEEVLVREVTTFKEKIEKL